MDVREDVLEKSIPIGYNLPYPSRVFTRSSFKPSIYEVVLQALVNFMRGAGGSHGMGYIS